MSIINTLAGRDKLQYTFVLRGFPVVASELLALKLQKDFVLLFQGNLNRR